MDYYKRALELREETVWNFSAGSAANIIPDTAVLQGTIRSNDKACRELLVRRTKDVSAKTVELYGGSAEEEHR